MNGTLLVFAASLAAVLAWSTYGRHQLLKRFEKRRQAEKDLRARIHKRRVAKVSDGIATTMDADSILPSAFIDEAAGRAMASYIVEVTGPKGWSVARSFRMNEKGLVALAARAKAKRDFSDQEYDLPVRGETVLPKG